MRWISSLLDLISPRQCVVCGQHLTVTEHTLCTPCVLHLPRTAYQFSPEDNPMAQLFWHVTPVERAAALIFYEPHSEVARVVYELKYDDHPDVGEDMGRRMATDMQVARFFDGVDVLLPVPLSRKRRWQRGYNQSEALARGISDKTGLPVVTGALRRRHFSQSQTQLSRQERQANVNGQFWLADAEALRGRHVLLVDDVCTTGATLIACVHALAGVEGLRVSVLTFGFTRS